MPSRRRPKQRVDHLVEALEAAAAVGVSLKEIDIRSCNSELKMLIKGAREAQKDLATSITNAIKIDVPAAPRL